MPLENHDFIEDLVAVITSKQTLKCQKKLLRAVQIWPLFVISLLLLTFAMNTNSQDHRLFSHLHDTEVGSDEESKERSSETFESELRLRNGIRRLMSSAIAAMNWFPSLVYQSANLNESPYLFYLLETKINNRSHNSLHHVVRPLLC